MGGVNKTDWQNKGGILEIPDGWFVYHAAFDVEEPHIVISPKETGVTVKESRKLMEEFFGKI